MHLPSVIHRQPPGSAAADADLQFEIDAERGQSRQRLIVTHLILIYGLVMGLDLGQPMGLEPASLRFGGYYLAYLPFVIGLALWIYYRPGRVPARRIIGMTADFAFLGLAIVNQPMMMMPLYTIFVWVTLGNGLRFGQKYLRIASAIACIGVLAVGLFADHGDASRYITAMALLTVIAIPHYASSLLVRVEQARKEADEANRAKSLLMAQASHDLRQPLHATSLFIASLQQTGLDPVQSGIVDRIDRALQGVARLFRSLLDLSTLDSGSVTAKLAPVPIGEVLEEIVSQNAELAARSGCDLRLVRTRASIIADRNLVTTMVQNLLSNAFKFAEGSGVLVGCRRRGETLSIEVLDQGQGIAESDLARIFDEFYQVRTMGDADRQGVGLGLAIVARMARLMGAQVRAASIPGRGSRFSIEGLQLCDVPLSRPGLHHESILGSPLRGKRILLVEDDDDIREATRELMEGWGCRTTAIGGIPDTIEPGLDLVVADFDLGGGVTGADCIAHVRRLAGAEVPALVITGHDAHDVAAQLDGNTLVLKKPLHAAELRSAIAATCR